MTTFCLEHGISRKTFYEIRKRVALEGPAAVLEPRSRRPRRSPNALTDATVQDAIRVRAALEQSGLDHGPISVHDRMRSLGIDPVPSTAALARISRTAGVARLEPREKPRAAYRRFVYPAPNACWQLDATEYVLTGGRTCVIFQLIDDHSRLAIASHAAVAETSADAIAVVKKGIAAHGVPQRLLSDNGAALNPSRRGYVGQLVAYLVPLGIEPITGKPHHPTTQGKNERFHRTLFRYLDKQPIAASIEQLQALVDDFDVIYNTQRPHQGLPGRITPQQAFDATPKADAPRPGLREPRPIEGIPARLDQRRLIPRDEIRQLLIHSSGNVKVNLIQFNIDSRLAGQRVIRPGFRSDWNVRMEPMTAYTPEMRERALRMLAEAAPDHATEWAAIRHVAQLLGMSPETLRLWRRRVEVDSGAKPGVTSEAAEEIKRLKREVAELRRANEILKSASVFFAKELDRPTTR